jgi:imidazoleglycerol phosphate dehydratase HisB
MFKSSISHLKIKLKRRIKVENLFSKTFVHVIYQNVHISYIDFKIKRMVQKNNSHTIQSEFIGFSSANLQCVRLKQNKNKIKFSC